MPHQPLRISKKLLLYYEAAKATPSGDRLCYLERKSVYLRATKPLNLRRADSQVVTQLKNVTCRCTAGVLLMTNNG